MGPHSSWPHSPGPWLYQRWLGEGEKCHFPAHPRGTVSDWKLEGGGVLCSWPQESGVETGPGDGRKGVGLVSNTTRGSTLIAVPLRVLCPRLCLPGSVPCQERHAEETWAAALPIHDI